VSARKGRHRIFLPGALSNSSGDWLDRVTDQQYRK